MTLHPQEQHLALLSARERQQTEGFKELYKTRAGVEGTVSQAAFALDMRRTRYRGLAKTHLHHLATLAELLAGVGVTAPQAMNLHVQVLEELVRGLRSRSARHVMTRADLLVLEVLVHLAERYRLRAAGAAASTSAGGG